MTEVRTRFAPSPTGFLHIGGARTALFSWLYARHHRGRFILRIEDTDSARSTEDSVRTILDGLAWLGMDYDEGPFYQLDNLPEHQEIADRLLQEDKAYHCYCTEEELAIRRKQQLAGNQKPRYDRRCRDRTEPRPGIKPTLRFKTPLDGSVEFYDAVHGKLEIQNSELDDLILIRSDGTPTYNFSVVIDDMIAGITHVIRGDDHLSNTPRQIHLMRALQAEIPGYAHLPMILDREGKRLSKREGAASVTEYREAGYLPEAVLNYLLRLGWSCGDREIFSTDEMIDLFDLAHVGKAAASLNPGKLDWLNQHYMREADSGRVTALFTGHLEQAGYAPTQQGPPVEKAFNILCDRYKNLKSMAQGAAFLYSDIAYDPVAIPEKLKPEARPALILLSDKLAKLATWNHSEIKQILNETAAESGLVMKQLGPAVRFALTGGASSPELPLTVELVGPKQSIARIKQALELIE